MIGANEKLCSPVLAFMQKISHKKLSKSLILFMCEVSHHDPLDYLILAILSIRTPKRFFITHERR